MTINSIIWQNIKCEIPSANKSWDWDHCLAHFRDGDMLSITRMAMGFTTEDSLVFGNCVITGLSPWGFTATAKGAFGHKLHSATITGKF